MASIEGTTTTPERQQLGTLIVLGVLSVVLLYCFGNSLSALWKEYWNDPQYSHGWLVPLFAAILLWMRWGPSVLPSLDEVPSAARWWGIGLLGAGLSMRLIATHFGMEVPDMVAFVPSLAGVVLLVGGWRLFVWAGPIVAFLVFMFPLPWRVSRALLVPLQTVATSCSTYLLQAMGYGAYREGNIIHIEGVQMEVVDACSGLRMLTIFVALCAAVAMIMERPWWERVVVFLSAVPIALAVNILRITATGMAHYHVGGPWIETLFHEWAGYVMMPTAMLLLYLQTLILSNLLIEEEHDVKVVKQSGKSKSKSKKTVANPLGSRSQSGRRKPRRVAKSAETITTETEH